jgi:hypothetical protein
MPVDHIYVKLGPAVASNTGNAQNWITAWDSYVIPEAGTIRAVTAVANSLTSNTAVHQVDVFRQPSGVSGASNSSASVLTAPLSLASNNNAVTSTSIAAGNQRVAAGDILQLKTNEALNATGRVTGLVATVLILPD